MKGVLCYLVLGLALLLFMVPEVGAQWDDGMEIIVQDFAIENSRRHQWHPYVEYNSIDNEFIGIWRTSGKLRDDCLPGDEYECTTSFHTIDGRRISPDGKPLGDPFQLSPPEPGWKQVPRFAHNIFTNEYLVAFSRGPIDIWDMTIVKIDSVGNIQYGPERLMEPGGKALLPEVIFNPQEREYLVVYTDNDIFNPPHKNNIGFILDENGNTINGPFPIGSQLGDLYAPTGIYNPDDNTYLIVWEDFRNVADWLQPCDIYGALLDHEGNMIVEIPIADDSPSENDQRTPEVAYNPDRNEFLVVWQQNAETPKLGNSNIYGMIIGPDGTPAGPEFIIVDAPRTQNMPQVLYVKDMEKYFMTWYDTRNDGLSEEDPWFFSGNLDIYARWLDPSGEPVGDEITITEEEGWQYSPYMAYNPVMKRFLIAWYEYGNYSERVHDYDVIPGGVSMWVETSGDVRGVIYGVPGTTCLALKIYGEYAEETELLRNFRDNLLSKTPVGQEIIRLYYEWSPAVVKAMEEDEEFKEELKGFIDELLPMIEKVVE